MAEVKITKDNFEEEVTGAQMPVLLDFWASWCGPCKMIAPILAEIAEEYEGRVKIGKVNVDDEPELAGTFHIASIPTLLLVREGKIVAQSVGYRPKSHIAAMLETAETDQK